MTYLKRFNWLMFAAMLLLIAVGTTAIWSAGNARAETVFHGMWKNNLSTAAVGLLIYFVLSAVDYRKILDWLSVPAYVAALSMLVLVLFVGAAHKASNVPKRLRATFGTIT